MNDKLNDNKQKDFEEMLKQELNGLEREVMPPRDLWPGIDHAINSNTVTFSKPLFISFFSSTLSLG